MGDPLPLRRPDVALGLVSSIGAEGLLALRVGRKLVYRVPLIEEAVRKA